MASSSSTSTPQNRSRFGDTTMTKVFVGGLAWETPNEKLHQYFRKFGDILEAVIITDKNTGKSKGYGFVTFREPEAARLAVQDPNPYIDGRRANCNIASLGRPRPSPPRGRNQPGSYQGPLQPMGPPYNRSPAQVPPHAPQFLYPTYGYMTYPPEYSYPHGMYNPQLGQSPYYQQQMFGATSPPGPLPYPAYPYGYYVQSPRASFTQPARPQFMQYPTAYHAEASSQQPNVVQLQLPSHARQSPNTTELAAAQQPPTTGANNESPDT